jgi:hypothetical protein
MKIGGAKCGGSEWDEVGAAVAVLECQIGEIKWGVAFGT